MNLNFTFDIVELLKNRFPDQELFHVKRSGKWEYITTSQFSESVNRLSILLLSEGIQKGECVASIFSYNSFEWNIIDMALSQIGAIHLPIYPTISDSDYLFILNQAEVRWVFVTDQNLYNKLTHLQCELGNLKTIVAIEKLANVEFFQQLLSESPVDLKDYQIRLEQLKKEADQDEVCTIIYTSGTTGFPKGVMLTHRNLCTNTKSAAASQPLEEGQRVLSYLPLCHIYERTAVYQFIIKGVKVYYAESLKALLPNIKEVKPDGTTVVPRVLEKILTGLQTKAENSNIIEKFFIRWSIRYGFRFNVLEQKNFINRWKHRIIDRLIYRSVRAILGGHLKYVGCGGASIDARILNFYWAAGIPVYEGYGLTECSPLVSLNFPGKDNLKIGTVGPILDEVKVRIAEDREILVKGPNVLKGYFKNPELTEQSFEDGWFCTGDLGEFIENRYLKIVGRKKEMFKTSNGKYIVPQAIESRFLDSPLIEYLIVIGEGKHFAAAIISPNFEFCRKLLPNRFIGSRQEIVERAFIRRVIQKEINAVNRELGKTEQINKFLIVEDTWSVDTGELSPTLKLKRNIIIQKYSAQIRDLYREDNSD